MLSPRQRRKLAIAKTSITLVDLRKSLTGTILTTHQPRTHWTLAGNPVHHHGNNPATRIRVNEVRARPPTIHSDCKRVTVLKNDNYCVPQWGFVDMARTERLVDNRQTLNVNYFAVNHVPFVAGQSKGKV